MCGMHKVRVRMAREYEARLQKVASPIDEDGQVVFVDASDKSKLRELAGHINRSRQYAVLLALEEGRGGPASHADPDRVKAAYVEHRMLSDRILRGLMDKYGITRLPQAGSYRLDVCRGYFYCAP